MKRCAHGKLKNPSGRRRCKKAPRRGKRKSARRSRRRSFAKKAGLGLGALALLGTVGVVGGYYLSKYADESKLELP